MSDGKNIPQQMLLPFESEKSSSFPSAKIFSFMARKESILSARTASMRSPESSENEILKRVLERAERLAWYK